jgi:hypothetical protein
VEICNVRLRVLWWQAVRYNCAEAMDAARSGTLLGLLWARHHHRWAKIAVLDMMDYAHNGRAPEKLRAMRQKFISGGRSGALGQLQSVDVGHEETEGDIHRMGGSRHTLLEGTIGPGFTVPTNIHAVLPVRRRVANRVRFHVHEPPLPVVAGPL